MATWRDRPCLRICVPHYVDKDILEMFKTEFACKVSHSSVLILFRPVSQAVMQLRHFRLLLSAVHIRYHTSYLRTFWAYAIDYVPINMPFY